MIDLTPNPKQLQYWIDKISYPHSEGVGPSYSDKELACLAYRAGADYELEACCKIMEDNQDYVCGGVLRAIRRPKPLSEAEQALEDLESLIVDLANHGMGFKTTNIRRALERLKKMEQLNDSH
jgi:hypothetical protein